MNEYSWYWNTIQGHGSNWTQIAWYLVDDSKDNCVFWHKALVKLWQRNRIIRFSIPFIFSLSRLTPHSFSLCNWKQPTPLNTLISLSQHHHHPLIFTLWQFKIHMQVWKHQTHHKWSTISKDVALNPPLLLCFDRTPPSQWPRSVFSQLRCARGNWTSIHQLYCH
jgi:hypothetical protein